MNENNTPYNLSDTVHRINRLGMNLECSDDDDFYVTAPISPVGDLAAITAWLDRYEEDHLSLVAAAETVEQAHG